MIPRENLFSFVTSAAYCKHRLLSTLQPGLTSKSATPVEWMSSDEPFNFRGSGPSTLADDSRYSNMPCYLFGRL
ncbi:hypothetical protein R1flu_000772 [Riccia fluitans]|uniref:Uncharacterized protein n=1 Tax=Riccia fluitans TaxID=41844 RepID=A0ABD1Y4I9_9MARC